MITRDEARRVASAHLRRHRQDDPVRDVLGWEEIAGRKPSLYLTRPIRAEDCWICYRQRDVAGLTSSEIVAVARETGEVIYVGSAGDEG